MFVLYPGYEQTEIRSITCKANGYWNADPPKCRRVKCKSEIEVQNGKTIFNGTTIQPRYGDEIRIECDVGYILIYSILLYTGIFCILNAFTF